VGTGLLQTFWRPSWRPRESRRRDNHLNPPWGPGLRDHPENRHGKTIGKSRLLGAALEAGRDRVRGSGSGIIGMTEDAQALGGTLTAARDQAAVSGVQAYLPVQEDP
jgi:hypothetical protein